MVTIPGFPTYAISKDGKIVNVKRNTPIKLSLGNRGYYQVRLWKKGKGYTKTVHRLVCIVFHGPPTKGKDNVCHNNGNRLDNRAENLRWGSGSDNAHDSILHGTKYVAKGEDAGRAILTNEEVLEIRKLYESRTSTQKELAGIFKVSKSSIYYIVNYINWKHI